MTYGELPRVLCVQKPDPGDLFQPLHRQKASLKGDTPRWIAASYPLQGCVDRRGAVLVDKARERPRGHKGGRP